MLRVLWGGTELTSFASGFRSATMSHGSLASAYEEEFDLFWLEPTNANNSQGLVTTAEIAEQYDLYTISRLQEVASELRLASVPEFEEREDGLIGLEQAYGEMNFASIDLYDYGLEIQNQLWPLFES